jgi:hypothetical protein
VAIACCIDAVTSELKIEREAMIELAFNAREETVFFTFDSGVVGRATWMSCTSGGRFSGLELDEEVVTGCLPNAGLGGWLSGRLEMLLTTLSRSWADDSAASPATINNAMANRYQIFFKLFKTRVLQCEFFGG